MGRSRARVLHAGFSLIELLVVIAIISILLGMYLSTLGKAVAKAKRVAAAESMHQEQVGRLADGANSAKGGSAWADKTACREAFRHTEQTSEGEIMVTEVRYVVQNDAEFRAYWHTMINTANPDEPVHSTDGKLMAVDEDGNTFELQPIEADGWSAMNAGGKMFPVMWEFLSTKVADTTTTGQGVTVLYSDGHVDYVPYPSGFPASPAVAQLSRRFVTNS